MHAAAAAAAVTGYGTSRPRNVLTEVKSLAFFIYLPLHIKISTGAVA
jgi:hypothetical protein